MSTNKTQHYHLHAWTAGDDFLRAEINENFAALDAALKSESDARAAAVTEEANARTAAVQGEADARTAAVQGEADARAALKTSLENAIKAETDARTAAVTAETNARRSAVSGEASARAALKTSLESKISALTTAVGKKATLVTGTYVGDDTVNRKIDVGANILAIIVEDQYCNRTNPYVQAFYGGLCLPGFPVLTNACKVEGRYLYLKTKNDGNIYSNSKGTTYVYLALVEQQ